MRADTEWGEEPGGLQAPHVVRVDAQFQMLYGDWNQICVATSTDGIHFERELQADGTPHLFSEEADANTRDPMALFNDGRWYVYYTAHPGREGKIYCRTSEDLRRFSEPVVVSFGGRGGTSFTSAECPHVVRRSDFFYLFRIERYGAANLTHVYASEDPLYFGIGENETNYVTSLEIAAPEIIVGYDGQDYVAALLPTLDGIRIAPLTRETQP